MTTPNTESLHLGPIPNRAPLLIGLESFMLSLAIIVTCLRTHLRRKTTRRLRLEDWCCIGATFVLMSMVVLHIISTRSGTGKHIWDLKLPEEGKINNLKTAYIGRILYPFATGLTRQSVLLLLLRIFPYKKFRRVVICVITLNAVVTLSSCLVVVFQCTPITNVFIPQKHLSGVRPGCMSAHHLTVVIPVLNVTLDLVVALLPVKMILGLSLPLKSKILILGMLGLGSLASVASGMRLISINHASKTLDITWASVEICVLAVAEITIGIVCVGAPAIRPLLMKTINVTICSFNIVTLGGSASILPTTQPEKSSLHGSITVPSSAKVRIRTHDDGSVEEFRPNYVSRTVTEIEASQGEKRGYVHDETRGETGDDSDGFTVGSHGIIRKMEVAVVISDRV